MFERFTEHAIKTIMLAQEEARRMGHNFVGTEQILLGLLANTRGVPHKILRAKGISLKQTRIEVERIISRGKGFTAVEIPFTPRAKRLLELSWAAARKLEQDYIGPEHLFLGLLEEGEGVAVRVLKNFGLEMTELKDTTVGVIKGEITLPDIEYPDESDKLPGRGFIERTWVECPQCSERTPITSKVCVHCTYGISDEIYTDCRFCKERIKKEAIKCKHCHSMLNEQ